MKKILLLTTPIKNSINIEVNKKVSVAVGILPPLGILYIASYIRQQFKKNIETKILDCHNKDYPELINFIELYKPDIIGISAFTHSLTDVILTAGIIKEKLPKSLICIGGPHANNFPKQLADLGICDIVIPQNGEQIFSEIIAKYLANEDLHEIKGIYLNNRFTGDRNETSIKLDDLPFPAIDLCDFKKNSYIFDCKTPMMTMISTKGCRNICYFCNTPKDIEIRSIQSLINEILYYKSYGVKEIYFVDDTFNITNTRLVDFSTALLANKITLSWSCRLRVDKLTAEDLNLAKKAGCHTIHFGIETCTDEGLKLLNKNITIEQIENAFSYAQKNKIRTMGYFMIGLPFEKNIESVKNTLDFAKKLKCSYALFNIFVPFPNTYLYNKALANGIIKESEWNTYLAGKNLNFIPPVWNEYFSTKDLISLLNSITKDFYFNFDYILRFLTEFKNYHFPIRKIRALLSI
ncbi:MAG: radical SAM protein [Endomicrobiaceae bacterium]|nr:radical SAM protein [Endomicrobiaceae bacterium]